MKSFTIGNLWKHMLQTHNIWVQERRHAWIREPIIAAPSSASPWPILIRLLCFYFNLSNFVAQLQTFNILLVITSPWTQPLHQNTEFRQGDIIDTRSTFGNASKHQIHSILIMCITITSDNTWKFYSYKYNYSSIYLNLGRINDTHLLKKMKTSQSYIYILFWCLLWPSHHPSIRGTLELHLPYIYIYLFQTFIYTVLIMCITITSVNMKKTLINIIVYPSILIYDRQYTFDHEVLNLIIIICLLRFEPSRLPWSSSTLFVCPVAFTTLIHVKKCQVKITLSR